MRNERLNELESKKSSRREVYVYMYTIMRGEIVWRSDGEEVVELVNK
jgi:hypothetical protein